MNEVNAMRSKSELDDEYSRCAALLGDKSFKIDLLNKEVSFKIDILNKEAEALRQRMHELNFEASKLQAKTPEVLPPEDAL
jgi:thiaminase